MPSAPNGWAFKYVCLPSLISKKACCANQTFERALKHMPLLIYLAKHRFTSLKTAYQDLDNPVMLPFYITFLGEVLRRICIDV